MTSGGEGRGQRNTTLALLGLLGLALALRVWGLPAELPYVHHADEPHNLALAERMAREGDPNPGEFRYPSLLFYVQAGGQLARQAVGGQVADDPGIQRKLAPGNVRAYEPGAYVVGRLLTTLIGLGLVAFAFLSTRLVTGHLGLAAFAGGLGALSPLAVEHSRLITPDTYAAVFSVAAVWAGLVLLRRPSAPVYLLAGACVGLAAASKYNAALAALPVAVAHFVRSGRRGLADVRLYGAGASAIALFLLATPFAVLDLETFRRDFLAEVRHYQLGHLGTEGGAFAFYASALARKEGVALILGLVGVASGLRRHRREVAILAVLPVTSFVLIGRFPVHFERNLLSLLGPLIVLAAIGLGELYRRTARLTPRARKGAIAAATAAALLVPLIQTVGHTLEERRDEREPARRWIDTHLPAGSRVVVEGYTPWVDPERYEVRGVIAFVDKDLTWYREEDIDYVVTSEQMSGRFLAHPDRYTVKIRARRRLLDAFEEVVELRGDGYRATVYAVEPATDHNRTR